MTETYLFKSTDGALKFAFAIAEVDIYASPVYVQEIRRHLSKSTRTEKLSPHDWHSQGSMIRQHVARLDPEILAYYGLATYSWDTGHRSRSLAALYGYATAKTPGMRNRQLMRLLVERYVGTGRRDRKTRSEIAREAGVHHSTAFAWEKRIGSILGSVHGQFFEAMDRHFEDSGLIPPQ